MNDLPPRWVVATGKDLFDFVTSGSRGWARYYSPTGAKFIRIGNLQRQSIGLDLEDIQRVSLPSTVEGQRTRLQAGDILVSITAELGLVGLVGEGLGEAYVNQHIALVRPSFNEFTPYVARYLISPEGQASIGAANRGVTRAGLGLDDIRALGVRLPPLAEQRRIVAKIDSLSAKSRRARDQLDHTARLVEKYKQAILAAELSPEGRTEVVRFGDIAALLNGDRSKEYPGDDEQLPTGHCLFLGTRNVRQGYFDFGETSFITKAKHLALKGGTVERGDIVITIRGTLGNCAVFDRSVPYDPVRINSAMAIIRPQRDANPAFLMWTVRSPIFLGWVNANAQGFAQPHLRGKDIEVTQIYFPALDRQGQIVRRIESAFAWIDRLASEATSARKLIDHLDQAVLAKAFRGELVPQNPNDEPASVMLERIRAERAAAPVRAKAAKGTPRTGRQGKPRS